MSYDRVYGSFNHSLSHIYISIAEQMIRQTTLLLACANLILYSTWSHTLAQTELAGTQPLTAEGDLAATMVSGVDTFLLDQIAKSVATRQKYWQRDFSSAAAYETSVAKNRDRLWHILGLRDRILGQRASEETPELEFTATTSKPSLLFQNEKYRISTVRWLAIEGLHGEGLLLEPTESPRADVVVLPDADQTPEMLCGLQAGVPPPSQIARRLAEAGCRVVVPVLINRQLAQRAGRAELTSREYLYRSAFELGRHLIGYELQKTFTAVDWLQHTQGDKPRPIAAAGYGEGGMLALYASALDTRVGTTLLAGSFGPREQLWQEPIDRNVFGILEQFGAAELATLVAPRKLLIDATVWPSVELPSRGGAPATLATPNQADVKKEFERLQQLLTNSTGQPAFPDSVRLFTPEPSTEQSSTELFTPSATEAFANSLGLNSTGVSDASTEPKTEVDLRINARQQRQVVEIDKLNQSLLAVCDQERRKFININLQHYDLADGSNRVDTSSEEKYRESIGRYRDYFRDEIVGDFGIQRLPANPRSRKTYETESWIGYEVMLDVFPNVFAYGILCLPKNIQPGERRPVVVCQHGLEGRPQDVVTGDHAAYHDFASKLAERGFVTFSPQNLYIGQDRFRTLQRKSYLIKKTLFSTIVPQHQQIVDWLSEQPFVDPQRIAFYGLSYGGKSAMRIPPLVPNYCLSICSADFNDWVWKNASSQSTYSYVWTGEYEIFEFDLGTKFNYAEMAALIAPRPFMVERGHFDGVAPDDRVASEFAKVRHLYSARLNLPGRTEIEWFVGPHTINGQATFDFLHRHLKFEKQN